jgi:hypothetical protein
MAKAHGRTTAGLLLNGTLLVTCGCGAGCRRDAGATDAGYALEFLCSG